MGCPSYSNRHWQIARLYRPRRPKSPLGIIYRDSSSNKFILWNPKQQSATTNPFHSSKTQNFQLCRNSHPLRLCPNFLVLSLSQRQKIIKKNKLCVNCLACSHNTNKCSSKSTTCHKRHHTLINPIAFPSSAEDINGDYITALQQRTIAAVDSSAPSSNFALSNFHCNRKSSNANSTEVVLSTATVTLQHSGAKMYIPALIYPPSQTSLCVARKLQLPNQGVVVSITGFGDTTTV